MSERVCHYGCGKTTDLRPYGPGGALVCRPCANATPERRATTEAAMEAVFYAAEAMAPNRLVILGKDGFHPSDGTLDPPPS